MAQPLPPFSCRRIWGQRLGQKTSTTISNGTISLYNFWGQRLGVWGGDPRKERRGQRLGNYLSSVVKEVAVATIDIVPHSGWSNMV